MLTLAIIMPGVKNDGEKSLIALWPWLLLPRARMRSKGLCDRSWCVLYIYISGVFWGTNLLSPHFERSILTQIGFSSNLMASGTA